MAAAAPVGVGSVEQEEEEEKEKEAKDAVVGAAAVVAAHTRMVQHASASSAMRATTPTLRVASGANSIARSRLLGPKKQG